jgi:hypothetical protein
MDHSLTLVARIRAISLQARGNTVLVAQKIQRRARPAYKTNFPETGNLIFLVIAITYKSHPRTMEIRGLGKEPRAFSREAEKMTTVVHFSLIFLVIFQKPETRNRKPYFLGNG